MRGSLSLWCIPALFLFFVLTGCGGGGSSPAPQPPAPTPGSFSISANPAEVVLNPGSSNTFDITVSPVGGFKGTVNVSVANFPIGITATPSSFSVAVAGTSVTQKVSLTATTSTATGTYVPAITGTGAGLSATAALSLKVQALSTFHFWPTNLSLTVRGGQSTTTQLEVLPDGDGGYEVELSAENLPDGVTASFSQNPIPLNKYITMTVSASTSAKLVQNAPVRIIATRRLDSTKATLDAGLSVAPPVGQTAGSRHDFIRMDGTPTTGVYDAQNGLLFVDNPDWNRVEAVSVTTKKVVRSIPVPSPADLDLSPDGKTLMVGTWTRQMFAIDTSTLKVVQRYVMPKTDSSSGLTATHPAQMASGKVLLVACEFLTTRKATFLWDLQANTLQDYPQIISFHEPYDVIKSADGTKAMLASSGSDGWVAVYDAATDSFNTHQWSGADITMAAVSPNGRQFILFDNVGLAAYDATLNLQGYLPGTPYGGSLQGATYNPEGSKIFLVLNSDVTPTVATVDATSLKLLGTAPAMPIRPPAGGDTDPPFLVSRPFGADGNGIVFGTAPHGVAFEDAAYLVAYDGITATPMWNRDISPRSGPLNSATRVLFSNGNPFPFVSDVWFGEQRGLNPGADGGVGSLYVDAPPSSVPGPVNVKVIEPNGIMVYNAQAFTYGPYLMEVIGNAGSPAGGATIDLLAMGVLNDFYGQVPDPALQVKIGGNSAQVVSVKRFWADYFPFPVADVKVVVPQGKPGAADVSISTQAGSMTLSGAFRYVTAISDYASEDKYSFISYDRLRHRLYLSAPDHVDVFSLDSRSFGTPISIPNLYGKMQLGGTALTPDGSKLLVANTGDGTVAIVNLSTTSEPQIVPVTTPVVLTGCPVGPVTIAAASNGKALVLTGEVPPNLCEKGAGPLYYVDYTNATVATGPRPASGCGDTYVSGTRDGSKIVFGGTLYTDHKFCFYNASTESFVMADQDYALGAAASGDGNVFGSQQTTSHPGVGVADTNAILLTRTASPVPMYQSGLGDFHVVGDIKFNDPGSYLYLPHPHSLDLVDVQHGDPRARVALTQTVREALGALATNERGDEAYLLTGGGLTVVELGELPVSIGSVTPQSAASGTQVTVRGSGFTDGTIAKLNGAVAPATVVDDSTLEVTIPSLRTGPAQMVITNTLGDSYTLDNAIQVQ